MAEESIEQFDYCMNQCIHHNRYDGWCNYYYKDICEIDLTKCEEVLKHV